MLVQLLACSTLRSTGPRRRLLTSTTQSYTVLQITHLRTLRLQTFQMQTPSNAIAASTFFLAALVLDALCAIESSAHADAPASLRGTCMALVACLAAPPVCNSETGFSGRFQRPVIGFGLAFAALMGLHHGGVNVRTFDGLYISFAGFATIYLFSSGGLDEMSKLGARQVMQKAVMKSSSTLAGGLAFYSGLRTVRAGFEHGREVSEFHVHSSDSTDFTLGYSYASQAASVALTAGGGVGVAAAVLVLWSHVDLSTGTDALATPLCAAGVFQLVAALAAGLTLGDQMNSLPAVFGATACKSATSSCAAATAARRFALANTPVAPLWVSALGHLALGFPPSSRLKEKTDVFQWAAVGTVLGTIAAAGSLLLVSWNATFDGKGGHTDYVLLAVIFGVYTSFFFDRVVGTLIYLVAMVVEEVIYVQYYGFGTLFTHLTHLTLVVTMSLLAFHTFLQLLNLCFRSDALYLLAGVVTAAGTSLSLGLYLGSATLLAVVNGNLADLQEDLADLQDNGSWFASSFVLQHFCPLLIWLPLVVCRCDFYVLSSWARRIVWVSALPVLLIAYSLCLTALGTPAPLAALVDAVALSGAVVGAVFVPWLVASTM